MQKLNKKSRKFSFFETFFLLAGLLFYLHCPAAAQDSHYPDRLVSKALKLSLAAHPRWYALLHYHSGLFYQGVKSLADHPDFFLADDGKTNPQSELAETIRSFFSSAGGDLHPQCLFPARYRWLKEMLNFDSSRLKEQPCDEFQEWYSALNPSGLTLVFPTSYINNPASTFGHTLLRIDQAGQDEESRLLAYTANYAAATRGEDAISYAVRGIFGGYFGFFSVQPYYQKVKQYSDMENRDIWEYELDLSPKEVEYSVLHLWELRSVAFRYFYFDENCSYQLLALLDAARPSLKLGQQFPTWVIPVDTIRVMLKEQGLIKNTVFRPSAATVLKHRISQTDPSLYKLSKTLAAGELEQTAGELEFLSLKEQAQALDLAYDFHHYQLLKEKEDDAREKKKQLALRLLTQRSKVGIDSSELVINPPLVRPEEGHRTSRLKISAGLTNDKDFWDLSYRTAYHDVLDPPSGYTLGAEINFLELGLRQYESETVKLERIVPLDILSLSPRNEFQKPLSWSLFTGWKRKDFPGRICALAFETSAGAGYSWELADDSLYYGLLKLRLLQGSHYRDNFSAGIEPTLGLLFNQSDTWGIHLNFSGGRFWSEARNSFKLSLEQRFKITSQAALRISADRRYDFHHHDDLILFSLDFYL